MNFHQGLHGTVISVHHEVAPQTRVDGDVEVEVEVGRRKRKEEGEGGRKSNVLRKLVAIESFDA